MYLDKLTFIFSFALVFFNSMNVNIASIDYLDDGNTSNIAPCVLILCEKYFKSERALKGSLVIINLIPNPTIFQREVLQSLNEDKRHEIAVMVKFHRKKHLSAVHVTEKAKNYFMLLSNSSELNSTLNMLMNLPTWNPLAQVVVLFTTHIQSTEELDAETKNVFNELLSHAVLNVNIMYQNIENPNLLQAVTWFPYELANCANQVINIRIIDECESFEDPETGVTKYEWKQFHLDLFPKLPKTLHMCPLVITANINEPYVVANNNESIEKGLEILMLETITSKLNLQPIYKIVDRTKAFRLITNDSNDGFYADLLQKSSDLMIGGLYENPISRKLLSPSIPYFQDSLTFCVTKSGLAPTWLNVFVIFDSTIWLTTTFILFVTTILIHFYVKFESAYNDNITWSLLIALRFTIAQYAHYWPKKFFIKLFLVSFMFYGLHFNAAYSSSLIKVLTRPVYEDQVENAEEAIHQQMKFKGGENTLPFFDKDDKTSQYLKSKFIICEDIDECLLEIKSDSKVAVAVSFEHAKNTPVQISDGEMFCFSNSHNIFTYSVVMMMKKDYHLLSKINDLIREISESGLLPKWIADSEVVRSNDDDSNENNDDGTIKLKIGHVEGAFLLAAIGLGLSTLAFIIEHLTFWYSTRRHQKLAEILEKYICFTHE